jgi:glycosyltransferase involved in cell wall biosynthesis
MKYDSSFDKNIGFFVVETSNIKYTSWPGHLNLMDEIWVPCSSMIKDGFASGITKPIKLVPHTFNIEEYKNKYPKLNLPIANKFTFYFVGEFNRRKHLSALIKAFHTEFSIEEPVELVLKVNKYGTSPDNLANEIKNFCNQIKDGLKLYKDPSRYKPEIIITVDIPREDLLRLHATCDCFVVPSYGEAWCIPAWEAMAMGKLVIASATGGMLDYIDSERNGFLVGGSMEPAFGQMDTFEEFGTAREQWFDISTRQLMQTMRRVYELSPSRKAEIGLEGHMSAFKYGYTQIGNLIKELLNV